MKAEGQSLQKKKTPAAYLPIVSIVLGSLFLQAEALPQPVESAVPSIFSMQFVLCFAMGEFESRTYFFVLGSSLVRT